MKRTIFYVGLAMVVMSCSTPSEEEMKEAATALCNCMEGRKQLRENTEYVESDDMDIVDFGFCTLDVKERGINPKSDKFAKYVKESCPDVANIQERFIKGEK